MRLRRHVTLERVEGLDRSIILPTGSPAGNLSLGLLLPRRHLLLSGRGVLFASAPSPDQKSPAADKSVVLNQIRAKAHKLKVANQPSTCLHHV